MSKPPQGLLQLAVNLQGRPGSVAPALHSRVMEPGAPPPLTPGLLGWACSGGPARAGLLGRGTAAAYTACAGVCRRCVLKQREGVVPCFSRRRPQGGLVAGRRPLPPVGKSEAGVRVAARSVSQHAGGGRGARRAHPSQSGPLRVMSQRTSSRRHGLTMTPGLAMTPRDGRVAGSHGSRVPPALRLTGRSRRDSSLCTCTRSRSVPGAALHQEPLCTMSRRRSERTP